MTTDELNAASTARDIHQRVSAHHIGTEEYDYALPSHVDRRVIPMNPTQVSEIVSAALERSAVESMPIEETVESILKGASKYHAMDEGSIRKIMEGVYGTR